jgi:hypothetical protein
LEGSGTHCVRRPRNGFLTNDPVTDKFNEHKVGWA